MFSYSYSPLVQSGFLSLSLLVRTFVSPPFFNVYFWRQSRLQPPDEEADLSVLFHSTEQREREGALPAMGASQWVTLLLILPLLARASEFSPHEQAARDAVSQLTWFLPTFHHH
jgi:hypothetical protein